MLKTFCRNFNKALGCKLSHLLNPLDKVKFMSLFLNMNPAQDCGRLISSRHICLESKTIVVFMQSNLYSLNKEIGFRLERLTYKMEREAANVKPRSSEFLSVHSPRLHGIVDLNPSLCVLVLHIETSWVRHLQTTETCAGRGLWLVPWACSGLWLASDTRGGGRWRSWPHQASVSSVKCPVLPGLLIIASCEERRDGDWREQGEWQRRRYKVHHYWPRCPCCASFRFLTGLVVSDSSVSEYSAHDTIDTCVCRLLPNQFSCRIRTNHSTITTQSVNFGKFNVT